MEFRYFVFTRMPGESYRGRTLYLLARQVRVTVGVLCIYSHARWELPWELPWAYFVFTRMPGESYRGRTLYLLACQVRVTVGVLCIYLYAGWELLWAYFVFTHTPGESCRRRLRPLVLCLCGVFRVLINSLVCQFYRLNFCACRQS